MKITDVSLHIKVKPRHINGDRKIKIGEIVSEEIKKTGACQFQVLVQYEGESRPRYVNGSGLIKVDW